MAAQAKGALLSRKKMDCGGAATSDWVRAKAVGKPNYCPHAVIVASCVNIGVVKETRIHSARSLSIFLFFFPPRSVSLARGEKRAQHGNTHEEASWPAHHSHQTR